jgi:hypothetical protein
MLGRLLEEAAGGAESGVGEDRVDAAELVQRPRRQALDLVPLRDVAGDRDRRLGTAELSGQGLERLASARRKYKAVPIGSQAGRRRTDAATGPGDQQNRFFRFGNPLLMRHSCIFSSP